MKGRPLGYISPYIKDVRVEKQRRQFREKNQSLIDEK